MAYPWRAVWRARTDGGSDWRFVISVPKRRLKKAVDRVKMRRRCREAYRLNRAGQSREITGADIAFVYVGNDVTDYLHTEKAIKKIVSRIHSTLTDRISAETDNKEDE